MTPPIILFSPIGAGLGFYIPVLFGLILSTPVVWWPAEQRRGGTGQPWPDGSA